MSAWGSKRNALLYSQSNEPQLQHGKKLAYTAGIKPGDKILDMGCGTGELTAFLAGMVGKQTPILGVDPDNERIKLAIQKHSGIHKNITFVNGDSSSQFPYRGEQYYDLHFSNFVIQWLNAHEKKTFIDTAFESLKPGGKIALLSHEKDQAKMSDVARSFVNDVNESTMETVKSYLLNKSETETLLEKAGFTIVYSEYLQIPHTFANVEDFLTFLCASDYYDDKKISQSKKNNILKRVVNQDGTVTISEPTIYQIIGKKS